MIDFPGFITVRTTSSRLPKKCLLPLGECNVLEHVIRRALCFGLSPIVCTSTDASDDVIQEIAEREGVRYFRGSLVNKLKRWADCAEHFGLDNFHTIDADDPFFDAEEMKGSMKMLQSGGLDMVCPTEASSGGGASVGFSLKTSIVKDVVASLADEEDTEMMWYYLEKVDGLKTATLKSDNPSLARLTLDYEEDYWLISTVCRILGNYAPRSEIDELFSRNPDLYKVNWFRNQAWADAQLKKKI
jgi:spore coat polysaccharide biosynthesis protein SpsF